MIRFANDEPHFIRIPIAEIRIPEFQNSRIPSEFREGGVEEHVGEISSSSFGKKFSPLRKIFLRSEKKFQSLGSIFTSSNLNHPPPRMRIPEFLQNSCESSPIEPCTVHSSFEICIQKYMFSDRTGPDRTRRHQLQTGPADQTGPDQTRQGNHAPRAKERPD